MKRALLFAVAPAIALLVVAGIGLVLFTERGPAPGQASTIPAATPSEAPAPPPAPAAPAPPTTAPPTATSRARSAPAPDAIRDRILALKPLRQEIFRALAAFDRRVIECRPARAPTQPAVMLVLEPLDGRTRVVEARVPTRAPEDLPEGVTELPEDPGVAACVQRALEGVVLDTPSAVPGRRWDMVYEPGSGP